MTRFKRKLNFNAEIKMKTSLAAIVVLKGGVRGHGGNAAVVASVSCHLDVAAQSPVSTPRVLDQPVVLAAVGTIAYHQHAVVQRGRAALALVVDTSIIQLE